MTSSNEACTACEQINDVKNITEGIDSITIQNDTSTCANCGKEGSDVNNICNKCKQVKYCNAACKKKHRTKHKKACERQMSALHDEELFKQPPPNEDCPICFLCMPSMNSGYRYMSCCGKVICSGCFYAPVFDNQGNKVDNKKCPFCRTPEPTTNEEVIERFKERVEANDAQAIYSLGCPYRDGTCGFSQDHTKAIELYHRAAELGYDKAYNSIGYAYDYGEGVEQDKKRATHYYELAAKRGNVEGRHNLGCKEWQAGKMNRALKHYTIAARSGHNKSLKKIRDMHTKGDATKEDYTSALRSYQTYLGEIKSKQRDEAAAANELKYRYY